MELILKINIMKTKILHTGIILIAITTIGVLTSAFTKSTKVNTAKNNDIAIMSAAMVAPNGDAYFFKGMWCHQYDIKNDKLKNIAKLKTEIFYGVDTNLDAAMLHPNGKGYIFKGNTYYRYNFVLKKSDKIGIIGKDGWKGLEGPIDAAIYLPSKSNTYFFKGNKYHRFNHAKGKVDKVGIINKDGWKGVPNNVDLAILHRNRKAYFFKDDQYYRYDFKKEQVDKTGFIGRDGWIGLFNRLDAANDGYFFRDDYCYYTTYKYKVPLGFMHLFATNKKEIKKGRIGYDLFRGVTPTINAVLTHPKNNKMYFFKEDKYYRYDFDQNKIDKIGIIGKDGWKGIPTNIDAVKMDGNTVFFYKKSVEYKYVNDKLVEYNFISPEAFN